VKYNAPRYEDGAEGGGASDEDRDDEYRGPKEDSGGDTDGDGDAVPEPPLDTANSTAGSRKKPSSGTRQGTTPKKAAPATPKSTQTKSKVGNATTKGKTAASTEPPPKAGKLKATANKADKTKPQTQMRTPRTPQSISISKSKVAARAMAKATSPITPISPGSDQEQTPVGAGAGAGAGADADADEAAPASPDHSIEKAKREAELILPTP
jgi:hypothetical protein